MTDIVYPQGDVPLLPLPTADRPFPSGTGGQEVLPIVREDGEVYARASRAYCHGGSMLLHPVVHLHIINRAGELYLQKRSMSKDLLPGRWDTAVGGHISYGEHLVEALYRESGEELGLYDYNPVGLISYVFRSGTEQELVNVFAAVGDFTPSPDGEEVSEGRYWPMAEIEEHLGKSVFTPNFEGEFGRIRKMLEALL